LKSVIAAAKGGAADEMGIGHNHGAVDSGVFTECEHDCNVELPNGTVDKTEYLFYTEIKNKCSAILAARKE